MERKIIRAALRRAHGIQERAAKALGIPRSTLQKWLASDTLKGLREYSLELRADHAPTKQGRPWKSTKSRTRAAVARAWKSSGYKLSAAARLLEIPRTSLRHLLYRYRLPNLPANGRRAQRRSRQK